MVRHPSFLVAAAVLLACDGAVAQRADTAAVPTRATSVPAADRYEPVFDELRHLTPRGDRVATVKNLTLRRDVIEFHLEDGEIYATSPVAGRSVAAVFVGHGSVSFAPPLEIERREMKRLIGDSVLSGRISGAAFVFTDSTLAELERTATFHAGGNADHAAGILHDCVDHLLDDRRVLQPTLMGALLNGETNGFFYVHVKRERGEDLMFVVDPEDEEPVQLLRGGREGAKVQVVAEFKRAEDLSDTAAAAPEGRWDFKLQAYQVEATIARGLGFSGAATVRLTARHAGVRWVRFRLFSELAVDSVSAPGGGALAFSRLKQDPDLWVRLNSSPGTGETLAVRVAYHGDLIGYVSVTEQMLRGAPIAVRSVLPTSIDRWFYVKTPTTWFPRYGELAADVDLTFHTPKRYRLASIGKLVDSRVDGDVVTTHWTSLRPADQVCFSLGDFDEFKITDPRIPPVTVHTNSDAHRKIDNLFLALRDKLGADDAFIARFLSQRDPEKDVGADVANSLAFFTRVYGAPLFDRYYATEIPFEYGEAFPGLIYLSVWTFQAMSDSGYEEIFRSHEMAHQWWGIGVEPAGYRDAWLSEGFAEFSGLWYMQIILRDNEKFFKHLKHWRSAIRARHNDVPPIGIGWRAEQLNERDYTLVTYHKGAWVLHMLRNLMLNLRTMDEDAFVATMRDFYRQYRGRRASTRDFQRVVEQHIGTDMSWFFDEWVDGTAIPTYFLSWHAEPAQNGHYTLQLRVRQEDVPDEFMMPVPVKIGFADSAMHAYVRMRVAGPVSEATLDLPAEPKVVELNPLESVLAGVKEEDWH
jgi:hypothetical protein